MKSAENAINCIKIFSVRIVLLTNMWSNRKINKLIIKRCLCAFLLLFITVATSYAQVRTEPKPPKRTSLEEEKAREQTRWMYKNLTLGSDQYEKVNEINLTYAFQYDSLDAIRSKAAREDGKLKIKQNKEAQIKAVLTPDQYKQYVVHKEKQVSQKKSPFSGTYFGK